MMTASRNCRLAILCSQAAGVLSVRSRVEREFRRKFFVMGTVARASAVGLPRRRDESRTVVS
jgi:hypothetical protein